MRLTHFGEIKLSEYNADDTFNLNSPVSLVKLEDGGFDPQNSRNYYGVRRLTRKFEFWASDTQTISEQMDELLKEFRKGRKLLRLETRDGEVRQQWAKALPVSHRWGRKQAGHQEMTVTFEMDEPLWRVRSDDPTYTDEGTTLSGDWLTTAGQVDNEDMTTTSHSYTITNDGGAPVFAGFLRLTPKAASDVVNPRVDNLTTGHHLRYVGTVDALEELEYDFRSQTAKLDDVNSYQLVGVPSNRGHFMELAIGDNDIVVIADSITGTVDVDWQWSKHYW